MITNFLLCYFLCCFLFLLEMEGLEGDGLMPTCLPAIPPCQCAGSLRAGKDFFCPVFQV